MTIWGYWGIFLSFWVKRAVLRYIGLNFRRIQGSPHRDYIPQASCGCHTMLRIDSMHALRRDYIQGFALMICSPVGLVICNTFGIDDIQGLRLDIYTLCVYIPSHPTTSGALPKGEPFYKPSLMLKT